MTVEEKQLKRVFSNAMYRHQFEHLFGMDKRQILSKGAAIGLLSDPPKGKPGCPLGSVRGHSPRVIKMREQVIEMKGSGKTYRAIANVLGITYQRVQQLIRVHPKGRKKARTTAQARKAAKKRWCKAKGKGEHPN